MNRVVASLTVRCASWVCAILVIGTLAGCGGSSKPPIPLAKTTGTVKYNGSTVADATVTMITKDGKHTATAQTDSEGRFAMTMIVGGKSWEGMPIGEVMIGVSKYANASGTNTEMTPEDMQNMMSSGGMEVPKSELPEKYASPKNSGLSRTVSKDESQNDFVIELE